jgi:hypothetical protein
MELITVYSIAKANKDYTEFKSQIDKRFNGTPETVLDNTKYKLVKVEEVERHEMFQNMQYYMEHCQRYGYITPQDWIEQEKHF